MDDFSHVTLVNSTANLGLVARYGVGHLLGMYAMIVVITIFDFGYQWYDNRKKLMMSRQEIKDEMKNTDGNPEVKGNSVNVPSGCRQPSTRCNGRCGRC